MTLDTSVPSPLPATTFGWDDRWRATAAVVAKEAATVAATETAIETATEAGTGTVGRVVRADRTAVLVVGVAGVAGRDDAEVLADPVAADLGPGVLPVTGDWVLLGKGRVTAVLPRRTALVRGAGRRSAHAQVLAANIDMVVVVHAATEPPNAGRLERLVTLAWSSGAIPLVVLTKADLAGDLTTEIAEVAALAPGVEVLTVSATTGAGLEALRAALGEGRTSVLLGRSGAGKTTLANALAGTDLAVRATRQVDGKGQHTTVARHLVALPDGSGALLDTPGLRGVQLWDSTEGLARTFAEVDELLGDCRFSDCAHGSEPGCALLAAVEDGSVEPARLNSWRRLQRENAALAARHDARLRAEQLKVWKRRARDGRVRNEILGQTRRPR